MRRYISVAILLLPLFTSSHLYPYTPWTTCDVGGSPPCKPLHWSSRNIDYWVNPAGSGLSSDQALTAIQSAFKSWENTGVGLTFTFRGFTDRQNGDDRMNVVFWSSDPSTTGSYAITIPSRADL